MIKYILLILSLSLSSYAVEIANSNGHVIRTAKLRNKKPVIVVDTLQLDDGKGTLILNNSKRYELVDVSGTSLRKVFAVAQQILPDTLTSINYYGIMTYSSGDSITIRSSNSNDSSLVSVIVVAY